MLKLSLCLVLVTMLIASMSAPGEDKKEEHPLVKQIKSKVKDPKQPFTLVLTFQAKDEGQLVEAFKPAMRATLKEKGCLRYDLNRMPDEPTKFLMYERWKSVPDIESHLASDHIKKLGEKLPTLLAGEMQVQVYQPVGE